MHPGLRACNAQCRSTSPPSSIDTNALPNSQEAARLSRRDPRLSDLASRRVWLTVPQHSQCGHSDHNKRHAKCQENRYSAPQHLETMPVRAIRWRLPALPKPVIPVFDIGIRFMIHRSKSGLYSFKRKTLRPQLPLHYPTTDTGQPHAPVQPAHQRKRHSDFSFWIKPAFCHLATNRLTLSEPSPLRLLAVLTICSTLD